MPRKRWIALVLIVVIGLLIIASLNQESRWAGIDEAVVERYATELGREPWQPLISLQGDALLFAFTVAGGIGGFVAGYYWREIFGSTAAHFSENASERLAEEVRRDV